MSVKNLVVAFVLNLIFFVGCATKTEISADNHSDIYDVENLNLEFESSKKDKEISTQIIDTYPYNLVKILDKHLNTKAGRDCSGFVSLINQMNGNIYFDENKLNLYYSNNRKSQAMYNLYKSNEKISMKDPKVGDLIFFSNTHSKKVKKILNPKKVTHVGIIRDIKEDGTIKFIHFASGKNTYGYMNLKDKNIHIKNNKIKNSYILRCSNASCLTSNRFIGYGKLEYE